MDTDSENTLDGMVDWIEEKLCEKSGISRETERPQQKNAGIPVPDFRAVTKGMIRTDGEKLQEAVDCLRKLLVTARYQISQLEEKNKQLESKLESDSVVRCPACCFAHKTKGNRFFPSYIKAIQSTCTLELTFKTKQDLLSFMVASQLDSDESGVPVLTQKTKLAPKGLGESGSKLTDLLLEKEKENSKLRIALPKKDEAALTQPASVLPQQKVLQAEVPTLRRSPRKLEQRITNGHQTPQSSRREQSKNSSDRTEEKKNSTPRKKESKSADRRTGRPAKHSHETQRSPPNMKTPLLSAKHTPRGTSFSFNCHMISPSEEKIQLVGRHEIRTDDRRMVERNRTEELPHRKERDVRREEAERTNQYKGRSEKRRCPLERKYQPKRRRSPERDQRGRQQDRDRRRGEERWSHERENEDRDSKMRGGLKGRTAGPTVEKRQRTEEPAPMKISTRRKEATRNREKTGLTSLMEPSAFSECSAPQKDQNNAPVQVEEKSVNTSSMLAILANSNKTVDLSEGELIDDDNGYYVVLDSDEDDDPRIDKKGEAAHPEESLVFETKKMEESSTEDENMDWFGEVVSDDNDVLGENYESASEDDLS